MDNSIDQQFVEFIVKSLVGHPDAVKIDRRIDEKGVLLELTVDPEDLGRVIGKRGATAQSLRTLLRALGTKNDARYNLKIIDNGMPPPSRRDDDRDQEHSETQDNGDKSQEQEPTRNEGSWGSDSPTAPTDDATSDDSVQAPVDTSTPEDDEDDHSSVVSKTRQELEDLDDLDV